MVNRLHRARFMRHRRYARSHAWMLAHRMPLLLAMNEIRLDYLLSLHFLRYLLIRYS